MKKLFLVVIASLALGAATVSAAPIKAYANPGDLSVQAGLSLAFYGVGLGFGIVPGAELGLTQFVISPQFPINVGVAARAYYSSYSYDLYGYTFGYNYYGLGAYGTAHWSPKFLGLQGDFWTHLDYYLGLGLDITGASVTGTYADYYKKTVGSAYTAGYAGGIGIGAFSGLSYQINDNLAVYIEGASFAGAGSTIFGAKFKF